MENQIELVKDIADGMIGIGGIPTNEEFYTEFNSRIVAKLGINTKCEWKHMDMGCFGLHDYVYKTSCNEEFDSSKINRSNFCPKCGKFVV